MVTAAPLSTPTSTPIPAALSVFFGNDIVGTLYRTDPLTFSYSEAWLNRAGPASLHSSLPLTTERLEGEYVHAFFENLLPEGDQRTSIEIRHKVSSVFGMLATIGGDTASAYVLLPQGQEPAQPIYQKLTWEQVNILLHNDATDARARAEIECEAARMPLARVSVSGAQAKMLLNVDRDGTPSRPMGASPSTHIVKPDMIRPDFNVFASAANEAIVMRAAKICQLTTANVFYHPVAKACVVERYDRTREADGNLIRLWQADFCQIAGKPSSVKYEHDGGPGFKECFDIVGMSAKPALDRLVLLRWLFFNLYVGNNESHAKNLALLRTSEGLRLAPFYDLMCTRVYSGLGPQFAFTVGGESDPGQMNASHLDALAESLGVKPDYMRKQAADMARRVSAAIDIAIREITPALGFTDKVLAERIVSKIKKITKQMAARLSGVGTLDDDESEPA